MAAHLARDVATLRRLSEYRNSRPCGASSGREVAIACSDGTVSVWDVSPIAGPLPALQRRAELLSAHRLESHLGLVRLTAQEMRARWEAMRAGSETNASIQSR